MPDKAAALTEFFAFARVARDVSRAAATHGPLARLYGGQVFAHALISFMGPHGYIAPAMVSKPDWAPTWSYQRAHFEVEIRFESDQGDTVIRTLVAEQAAD